jgi:uncharacterized damage-inducible protein DinB
MDMLILALRDAKEYKEWANRRLLEASAGVPSDLYHQRLPSRFPSLGETLVHIVSGEWLWLQRWRGDSPRHAFHTSDYPTAPAVWSAWLDVVAEQRAFLCSLSEERLADVVSYRNLEGVAWSYPLWKQLLHLVNHLNPTLQLFALLEGCWRGTGRVRFPTIAMREFEEETSYIFDRAYPLVRYEQRVVLLPERRASHWEVGFVRPVDGSVEVSNAQDGGRVEVLSGKVSSVDGSDSINLVLHSLMIGHDARVLRTRRVLSLSRNSIRYEQHMVTTTTQQPVLEKHLEAQLERISQT